MQMGFAPAVSSASGSHVLPLTAGSVPLCDYSDTSCDSTYVEDPDPTDVSESESEEEEEEEENTTNNGSGEVVIPIEAVYVAVGVTVFVISGAIIWFVFLRKSEDAPAPKAATSEDSESEDT